MKTIYIVLTLMHLVSYDFKSGVNIDVHKHTKDNKSLYIYIMFIIQVLSLSKLLRHRGPDWNGITCFRNCYLAHERLAINGLLSGQDSGLKLCVNGVNIYIDRCIINTTWNQCCVPFSSATKLLCALLQQLDFVNISDAFGLYLIPSFSIVLL